MFNCILLKVFRSSKCSFFLPRFYSSVSSAMTTYDLIVIGGGSGGLACVKEAASLGAKAAVLDFVTPSPQGTRWGLGGTCVNVGCIPKKLFHQAALHGGNLHDAQKYGWKLPDGQVTHDWSSLVTSVTNYIRSLNFAHRVALQRNDVEYVNGKGIFIDSHTVSVTKKNGQKVEMKAKNFVIAVGGRPRYPEEIIGGKEYAISSDDIFWRSQPPGKTLVVGASYVALECAGFLTHLGYSTTLMMRSIPLRGFDQQMANLVAGHMEENGTRILRKFVPISIELVTTSSSDNQGQQLRVKYAATPDLLLGDRSKLTKEQMRSQPNEATDVKEEIFDSVLFAIGRDPDTSTLNLDKAGVQIAKNGKVLGGFNDDSEQSSVPHIYALGDCLEGGIELTPVAIYAGRLIAHRLFDKTGDNGSFKMDYNTVPTTVFTPLEYGTCGPPEERANMLYGAENLEVFHSFYKPLEYTIAERSYSQCYIKVVCMKEPPHRIISFHVTGPNAGEITQGFTAAIKNGLTYEQLRQTIGIHPTCAEEVVKLTVTKRSNLNPEVASC